LEGGGDILVFPRGRQVTEKSDVAPRESRPVTEVTTAAQADLAETNPRRETQSSVAAEQPGEPRTGEPRRSATAQTVMLGVLILLGTAWALSETASRCQDAPVHAASLAGLPKAKLEMLT